MVHTRGPEAWKRLLTSRAFKNIVDLTWPGDRLADEVKIGAAMAGNRTRVNCLEGSYAHHYTTIAGYVVLCWYLQRRSCFSSVTFFVSR